MERWAIEVRGLVQGVGFRPFVYNLAARGGLRGFVKNQAGGVLVEVEGEAPALESFLAELSRRPPPLARIEQLSCEVRPPQGDERFSIEPSQDGGSRSIVIAPDLATCPQCLAELFDPDDRRFGYPFLNCTNCGPRLTVITGAPYDRQRTTMAPFRMCASCQAEYHDPADRRFHAQPTACPECGPSLQIVDAGGQPVHGQDPLGLFVAALAAGKIGAMKGLGGFHLTCDARNGAAIAELRRRKHRDEKPFAVMVPDIAAAAVLCEVQPAEQALLLSPAAPIVLLRKRTPAAVSEAVAPRNPRLGVMLPYTPLHHLLMRAIGGIPLVMTSGNRSDEPIAYGEDATERLAGIADLFLIHDRAIHVRCDDSVTSVVDGAELPVRRSRGYAPLPIELPTTATRAILALGGQLKGTFSLGRGRQAFLSHHLGDLDHYDAYRAFERDIRLYEELFAIRPEYLVHDLHPDYATTRYARERAERDGLMRFAVEHHHAHMASCMSENGLAELVIGVTFDGAGYGADGTVWGGEFLVGDYRSFRRAAHLRPVGAPGGDLAAREPWRMAVAHLADAGMTCETLQTRLSGPSILLVERMLERRLNSPLTSSAGRLFDAVASIAGVRDRVSHEGQAAIELEYLASGTRPDGAYPFGLDPKGDLATPEAPLVIDTRPLIRTVADDTARGVSQNLIARRFHSTLVELIASTCARLRQETGIEKVVLSGGVFLNGILAEEVSTRLRRDGFLAYRHRRVPPNDGGLCLGQLAVAAARNG
jgi:hydrogenase maturation protein HypF